MPGDINRTRAFGQVAIRDRATDEHRQLLRERPGLTGAGQRGEVLQVLDRRKLVIFACLVDWIGMAGEFGLADAGFGTVEVKTFPHDIIVSAR